MKYIVCFPRDISLPGLSVFLKAHCRTGLGQFEWEVITFLFSRIGFIESGVSSYVFERSGNSSIFIYLYIVPDKRRDSLTVKRLTLGRDSQNVRRYCSPDIVPTNTPS